MAVHDDARVIFADPFFAGISKGKEYATDGAHGQIITDQYVTAAHGKAVRDWPFIACSNQPFTEV